MGNAEVRVSTRISKALHTKIVDRQKETKQQTGIEATFGAVMRAMLEEAAEKNGKKR